MHSQDEKKTVDDGASRERQVRGQRLLKLSPLQILTPLRPFTATHYPFAAAHYPLGPPFRWLTFRRLTILLVHIAAAHYPLDPPVILLHVLHEGRLQCQSCSQSRVLRSLYYCPSVALLAENPKLIMHRCLKVSETTVGEKTHMFYLPQWKPVTQSC